MMKTKVMVTDGSIVEVEVQRRRGYECGLADSFFINPDGTLYMPGCVSRPIAIYAPEATFAIADSATWRLAKKSGEAGWGGRGRKVYYPAEALLLYSEDGTHWQEVASAPIGRRPKPVIEALLKIAADPDAYLAEVERQWAEARERSRAAEREREERDAKERATIETQSRRLAKFDTLRALVRDVVERGWSSYWQSEAEKALAEVKDL